MFWEGVRRGVGGVEKTSKINIFKNVWEYFSCVGGIKIRGLGMVPDQQIQKSKNLIFCILGVGGMGEALYY